MTPLREALERIETLYSYGEVVTQVVIGEFASDAHDVAYVARLLFLADTRPLTIEQLISSLGMFPGHFYRSLKRAGVEFRVCTSKGARTAEHIAPWHNTLVWHDPLQGKVHYAGKATHATFQVGSRDSADDGIFILPLDQIPEVRAPFPMTLGLKAIFGSRGRVRPCVQQ